MKRSWVASFLVIALLLSLVGCNKSASKAEATATSAEQADPSLQRLSTSWIGLYANRDEKIAKLLTEDEGWLHFREMDLFEAIRFFSSGNSYGDFAGLTRAYLEMAETFSAIDALFLNIEAAYLQCPDCEDTPDLLARKGFILLRRGELDKAKEIFSQKVPMEYEGLWLLGNAGIELLGGDEDFGRELLEKSFKAGSSEVRQLVEVAAFSWDSPLSGIAEGYYSDALSSYREGAFAEGLFALQMLDFAGAGQKAEPGIFVYRILSRFFASLARASAASLPAGEKNYFSGMACRYEGDFLDSEGFFSKLESESFEPGTEALIFGPLIDASDMLELSTVYRGESLISRGMMAEGYEVWRKLADSKPTLVPLSELAKLQALNNVSGPLSDPYTYVETALSDSRVFRIKALEGESGEMASALLASMQADLSRKAASVSMLRGAYVDALDKLDGSRQKRNGYNPDFINPPSFFVELGGAYLSTGQYAPAVEILFELSRQFPSARLCYESLKRLYASRTGGEAPPR